MTNVLMPHVDKNNLKQAGIVTEDVMAMLEENLEVDVTHQEPANIALYKTIFQSFRFHLRFLALKKPDENPEIFFHLPAQFKIRFKLYNFEEVRS